MTGGRRFRFRLALGLGCTVAELEDRASVTELAEWAAFYQLEPWGFHAHNFWGAMGPYVAARIAGSNSARLENYLMRPPGEGRGSGAVSALDLCAALGVVPPWAEKLKNSWSESGATRPGW